MPSISLRIDLDSEGRLGPGKIELLEKVEACGSISEAARSMNMSYKRAWDLIEEINGIFGKQLVSAKSGGKHGGGASLTDLGCKVVARFREIEKDCLAAARSNLDALQNEISR
jgi:molybdate transport system regulatory protein